MIVVMAIGLYTVRAFLHLLGAEDYGIYNVVGGVVAMFSFINTTLATSSQRYFSIEIANNDTKALNKWFCLNVTSFSALIIVFVIIAETIGVWFVNTQMTIPGSRLYAANIVFQLSVLTFCANFYSIPYNALIIAHERMEIFAYISIVEAFLKIVIVVLLSISSADKLIYYGFLMFLVSIISAFLYILYCNRKFPESKWHFYWNKVELVELLNFCGWHFLGSISLVVRSQGINILINMFFSPAVNAARAVAFQVYNAVSQLSNNFFVAVKPQIYKTYTSGEKEELYKLILRSTIICSLLVSVIVFPIIASTPFIMECWLKEVPAYTIAFTQLVLINGLIDATNGPSTTTILASGKIKCYEITMMIFYVANLPISYVALKLGADPISTMLISIVISLIVTVVRTLIIAKIIYLPFRRYMNIYLRIFVVSLLLLVSIQLIGYNYVNNFFRFILISLLIIAEVILLYIVFVLEKNDLIYVGKVISDKCGKWRKR